MAPVSRAHVYGVDRGVGEGFRRVFGGSRGGGGRGGTIYYRGFALEGVFAHSRIFGAPNRGCFEQGVVSKNFISWFS